MQAYSDMITVFLISFSLVLLLTPVCRKLAVKSALMDKPSQLKLHAQPIPYLGGVAVYLAFWATVFVISFYRGTVSGFLICLFIGSSIISLIGLIDDIKDVDYRIRLLFHILASLIVIAGGLHIDIIILPYPVNVILTLLWLVGITNAFNIIDIIDGLATGVAAISSLSFMVILLVNHHIALALLAASLLAALLGFSLFNNFRKASIFLGDCGSGFIGYILGAVSIAISYTTVNHIALFVPLLILGIPIYDTLFVVVMRLKNGRHICKGSRDHFALRLLAAGLSKERALLSVYMICFFLGLLSVVIVIVSTFWAFMLYLGVLVIGTVWGYKLGKIPC